MPDVLWFRKSHNIHQGVFDLKAVPMQPRRCSVHEGVRASEEFFLYQLLITQCMLPRCGLIVPTVH
jgi:hypothetical protein